MDKMPEKGEQLKDFGKRETIEVLEHEPCSFIAIPRDEQTATCPQCGIVSRTECQYGRRMLCEWPGCRLPAEFGFDVVPAGGSAGVLERRAYCAKDFGPALRSRQEQENARKGNEG